LADPTHEPHPLLRKMLPFTTVAVIIALLYVGWTFFSRWQEGRELKEKQAQQQVDEARRTIAAYGNGRVKIMNFTISPGIVGRGDKISICYGVSNAKTVTIDPKPDEGVWPSLARCVEASPTKATTYTLTASDGAGHTEQKALTIQVQ
jgi:hypothetical protein